MGTELNINIQEEQKRAQEIVAAQGLRVLVCNGTGCIANGSNDVIAKFKELGADVSILTQQDKMTIVPTGCHGFCEQGVLVIIPDLHITYVKVKPDDVAEIVDSHIKNGKPVERLLYVSPKTCEPVYKNEEIEFYSRQTRTSLANCGKINAECLDDALANRAYEALSKVLTENNPDAVICVMGCYSQLNHKEASNIDGVSIVTGTSNRSMIYDLVMDKINKRKSPYKRYGY